MLSVFKLVSKCHVNLWPGPQGLRGSKCHKLIFGNIIVVIGTIFDFFGFFINLKFKGL